MGFDIIQGKPGDGFLYIEKTTDTEGTIINERVVKELSMDTILNIGIKAVEAQDKVLVKHYNDMSKQTEDLTNINKCIEELNALKQTLQGDSTKKTGALTGDALTKLNSLIKEGLVSIGGIKLNEMTIGDIETVLANLSTAQSSQGALNEDMSLRLNQAASSRTAIFTQLQTLLQTLMQTRQQLSRF